MDKSKKADETAKWLIKNIETKYGIEFKLDDVNIIIECFKQVAATNSTAKDRLIKKYEKLIKKYPAICFCTEIIDAIRERSV